MLPHLGTRAGGDAPRRDGCSILESIAARTDGDDRMPSEGWFFTDGADPHGGPGCPAPACRFPTRIALALCLLSATCAATGGDWRPIKEDPGNDVRVLARELPSGQTEFKAVTHVESTLSACVALIRDVNAMPDWVHRTEKARVLHWISETEVIAYNVSRLPWPLHKRYAIVHSRLEQDPDTLAITINGRDLQQYRGPSRYDYRDEVKAYVRMRDVESSWTFAPQGDGRVEVTFRGYGNPGGNAAEPPLSWLVDMLVWKAPYETMLGLRRMIGRPRYQQASFDFIREPDGDGDDG